MGAEPLFRGRNTIFRSERHLRDSFQAPRDVQRRPCALYVSSVSSVGDQTPLESGRGRIQEQEMVDSGDAGHHYSVVCASRAVRESGCVRAESCDILCDSICFGNARHSRGRVLYAGARRAGTVAVCGHQEYFLQDFVGVRAGSYSGGGRIAGGADGEYPVCLEGDTAAVRCAVCPAHALALPESAES